MTANKGQNRLTARRGARRREAPTTSKTKGKSLAPRPEILHEVRELTDVGLELRNSPVILFKRHKLGQTRLRLVE